jgi:uncharacterized membrane protein HdeD (DUF308 family)
MVIENIHNDKRKRKRFWDIFTTGCFTIVLGLVIDNLSYPFSAGIDAFSIIFFLGILVWGVITITRGFILYRR